MELNQHRAEIFSKLRVGGPSASFDLSSINTWRQLKVCIKIHRLFSLRALIAVLAFSCAAKSEGSDRACLAQDGLFYGPVGSLIATSMSVRQQEADSFKSLDKIQRDLEITKSKSGIAHRSLTCGILYARMSLEEANCGKLDAGPCRNSDGKIYGTQADKNSCKTIVSRLEQMMSYFQCPAGKGSSIRVPSK